MSSTGAQEKAGAGSLGEAISRHVVRLFADYTGRGPTRARTTIRGDVVAVLCMDNMTRGERRLVEAGEAELVTTVRRRFQVVMREELVAGVEQLTGRNVVSFLSDHNSETDHAIEVFVLESPLTASGANGDAPELDNERA